MMKKYLKKTVHLHKFKCSGKNVAFLQFLQEHQQYFCAMFHLKKKIENGQVNCMGRNTFRRF